jgi:hypothetical protein
MISISCKICFIHDFLHFKRLQFSENSSFFKNQVIKFSDQNSTFHLSVCHQIPDNIIKQCSNIDSSEIPLKPFFIEIPKNSKKCLIAKFEELREVRYKTVIFENEEYFFGKLPIAFFSTSKILQPIFEFSLNKKSYFIKLPAPSVSRATVVRKDDRVEISLPGNLEHDSPTVVGGYLWTIEHKFWWYLFGILKVLIVGIGVMTYKLGEGEVMKPFNFCTNFFIFYWIADFIIQAFGFFSPFPATSLVLIVPSFFAILLAMGPEELTKKYTCSNFLCNLRIMDRDSDLRWAGFLHLPRNPAAHLLPDLQSDLDSLAILEISDFLEMWLA